MPTRTSIVVRFIATRTALVAAALLAAPALRAQSLTTEGPTVMLAPLLVEDTKIRLTWRYASIPGREILSACDDRIAADIIERVRLLDDLMEAIVPQRFLAGPKAAETLILIDEKTGQEAMADIVRKDGARARFMPNLRLMDQGSVVIFALVTPSSAQKFGYTQERVMTFLERRVPRLPDWFIEGVRGFYNQMTFGDREIEVAPATWLSRQETEALRTDGDRPRLLWPMEDFFAGRANDDGPLQNEWRAQAAMFVRWALLENNGPVKEKRSLFGGNGRWALPENNGTGKEALWNFIDRLEQEPPSEALFREHFGLGYADMRDELSDYLTAAIRQTATIAAAPSSGSTPPRVKFRAATDLEVARIRGEWERMEISYARANSPTLVDRYITQARKTFHRVYDRGERDPRLLASMGLMELDAGDPVAARPLLEAAVAANVVRANVYFELARLRYGAIEKEIGPKGKLKATQVADVLSLLSEGQRQDPPLLENYALMTEVIGRSDSPPTAAQLAAMHEGALKFPHVSALVARVIAFHVANGQPNAANALAEVGRRYMRPRAATPTATDQAAPGAAPLSTEARFLQARTMARDGDPVEALRALLWCREEGLAQLKPEVAKIQQGFVLSALGELAKRYSPAGEVLRAQRVALLRRIGGRMEIAEQMKEMDLLEDYVQVVTALPLLEGVQGITDLLNKVPKGDLRRATLLMRGKDLLVEAKRYDLAMEGTEPRQLVTSAESMLAARRSTNLRPDTAPLLARQVVRNIEILAGVGELDRARELAKKLLATDNSPETRTLIQQRTERAGHPELLSPAAAESR